MGSFRTRLGREAAEGPDREPCSARGPVLHSNILVPKLRVRGNEIPHQLNAHGILTHVQLQSLGAEVILRAFKCQILADDDAWNFVEQCRAAAHWTW